MDKILMDAEVGDEFVRSGDDIGYRDQDPIERHEQIEYDDILLLHPEVPFLDCHVEPVDRDIDDSEKYDDDYPHEFDLEQEEYSDDYD